MNVHVHDVRRLVEQVIVQRSDVYSGIHKLLHDRPDFAIGEDEIAHDIAVITHRLKGGPGTQRKSRFDFDAIGRDLQIRTGHRETVRAVRLILTRSAHCIVDRFPAACLLG